MRRVRAERADREAASETERAAEGMDEKMDERVDERVDEASGLESGEAVVSRVGFAPITRVDAARREIELCATSEALDSFGTIFDYDASRDAFTRWIGNVREMHERRAVGSSVAVRCDNQARRVYVRARISRGAQDTWEKVLDGTLRGASIGATNVIWRRERRSLGGRSRMVNVATRYDLAELSLVDNPANPDALGVAIVRNAQPDLALLDTFDSFDTFDGSDTRAASDDDAGAAPVAQEAFHVAARAVLAGCGCALCSLALAALDASEISEISEISDGANSGGGVDDRTRASQRETRAMAVALRASARELSRLRDALRTLTADVADAAGRAVERRAADTSASATAQTEVAALRSRLERLEAQPMPGGPAAHATLRAAEKTLAAVPTGGAAPETLTALEALAGRLRDPQAQMAVAAEMIRLQQEQG